MNENIVKQPTRTIVAVEHDGLNVRVLAIMVRILDQRPGFDIRQAVKAACLDYVGTEDGRKTYSYNCGCFNWADFACNVPNEICRNHGFERICSDEESMEVDWDEQLINEDDVEDGEDE